MSHSFFLYYFTHDVMYFQFVLSSIRFVFNVSLGFYIFSLINYICQHINVLTFWFFGVFLSFIERDRFLQVKKVFSNIRTHISL